MPLTDRKAITPTANVDPTKAEQVMFVNRVFTRVDIHAESDNTGEVRVGFQGTSADADTPKGFPLLQGDSYVFLNVNLKWIYVAGLNDGDAITFNATD